MTTKLISLFALCVLLGTVMLACGGAANNANTAANANTNANTKAAATATPAAASSTASAAGDKIGVAECDDFLAKYDACVSSKVPAALQATFKSQVDTWRSSWKKLAETPQGKAGLATACKASLDQAKTSLGSYGCAW